MLDYISRTQVEMAGQVTPPNNESRRPSSDVVPQVKVNGVTSAGEQRPPNIPNGDSIEPGGLTKDFKELSSVEMMDRLTRDLVKWQNQFAS